MYVLQRKCAKQERKGGGIYGVRTRLVMKGTAREGGRESPGEYIKTKQARPHTLTHLQTHKK